MTSGMFRLNYQDFAKGVATAVFSAIVVALYGVVQTPGFNIFATDWGQVGQVMLNVSVIAFIGYMGKNFFSDNTGAVLGRFGGKK